MIDQVIAGILKKKGLDKVPDYVGKGQGILGSEYLGKEIYDTSKNVGYSVQNIGYSSQGLDKGEPRGILKSPQMQFLSPLLSSPKYESKTASLLNSYKKE